MGSCEGWRLVDGGTAIHIDRAYGNAVWKADRVRVIPRRGESGGGNVE